MLKEKVILQKRVVFFGFCCSFLLFLILNGGLIIQNSLFACFPLLIAIFFSRRTSNPIFAAVAAVCFALLGLSLWNTKSDFLNSLQETQKIIFLFLSVFCAMAFDLRREFSFLIYFSAVGVAIIGILSYCGLFPIAEYVSIQEWEFFARLQSTFRYANTACAFIGCGYLAFLTNHEKIQHVKWGNCSAVILLTAAFLTISKAGIPIVLVVCLTYCLIHQKTQKLFLSQFLVAGITAGGMLFCAKVSAFLCIPVILLGAVAGYHFSFSGVLRKFRIYYVVILIGLVACSIILILKTSAFETFGERLEYYRDAVRLIQKFPLLGCGAGGWRDVCYSVQSSVYFTTFVHSGWLQFAVENGMPFVLLIVFLLIVALRKMVKNKQWELLFPVALLSLHAMVDIDFSFTAILMLFGTYIGSAIGTPFGEKNRKFAWNHILACVIAVVALVAGITMLLFFSYNNKFTTAFQQKDYIAAQQQAEQMNALFPRSSTSKMRLATCAEKNKAPAKTIKQHLQDAVHCAPYDIDIYRAYMGYFISDDNAEEMCDHYIRLQPMLSTTYDDLSDFLGKAKQAGLLSEIAYQKMCMFTKQSMERNLSQYYSG